MYAKKSSPPRNLRLPACGLAALLCLAACAHVAVQDMGSGRHALVAVSSSGGYYGSHEEAFELASDYCSKYRQGAVIERFDDQPGVGAQGQHTSRLEFSCVPPRTLHF